MRRTGEATTLSQIQRLVEEAQRSRSRFQALADRAAAWLTLIALGAGALTVAVWLLAGAALDFAVTRMVTVMVVACPHALGLAIPLVIVNATAMSARHGILVRNREAFERARETRVVAFDKTGTLTEGRFGVRAIYAEALARGRSPGDRRRARSPLRTSPRRGHRAGGGAAGPGLRAGGGVHGRRWHRASKDGCTAVSTESAGRSGPRSSGSC